MTLDYIVFGILAVLAIATAITTIASRHPIISAMSLVAHCFMLAGLYLTLQAQLIAVLQILVYAGAIMVLVIFVIMLLNIPKEEKIHGKTNFTKVVAILLSAGFAIELITVFISMQKNVNYLSPNAYQNGTAAALSKVFFNSYLIPFEAIGLLLLAAIIGAVMLAKRKLSN